MWTSIRVFWLAVALLAVVSATMAFFAERRRDAALTARASASAVEASAVEATAQATPAASAESGVVAP